MLSGVEFDCDPIRAALDPAILTHFYGQKLSEMAKNGPPVVIRHPGGSKWWISVDQGWIRVGHIQGDVW